MLINYSKIFENKFTKEYEGKIVINNKGHIFRYFKNNNRFVYLEDKNAWREITNTGIGLDIAQLIDYMEENKC